MPLVATKGAASAQGFGEFAKTTAAVYIEDVFQTWLYTGNGTSQTITNGIDLSGKGGLVWVKGRNGAFDHNIADTIRGVNKYLVTNNSDPSYDFGYQTVTSFNSSGFNVGNAGWVNTNNSTYASWTFRNQPKFFDIVTWTGNGGTSGRTITHNLGSIPGCIIVKNITSAEDWYVYHRSLGNTGTKQYFCILNSTAAQDTGGFGMEKASNWTSTQFALTSGSSALNTNGITYVAYLFAHDAGGFGTAGTDNVISCGSFTTDGSGNATVSLGYEPQWLIYKRSDSTSDWIILDTMRGWANSTAAGSAKVLKPNLSNAEVNTSDQFPTATGFQFNGITSSATYIYIAIRRGPMKTPTSGTSIFSPNTATDTEGQGTIKTTNFPVDLQISKGLTSGQNWTFDRMRGFSSNTTDSGRSLITNDTAIEASSPYTRYWTNTNFQISSAIGNSNQIYWNFGRAPGFFDVVCYTGNATNGKVINHNLGVAPELIIFKARNDTQGWPVYHFQRGRTAAFLNLTTNYAITNYFSSTAPTSTTITLANDAAINGNLQPYVAYLFASVTGVSKVGSYTGTGSTLQINCGFTNGSRFVLIKRTDSTGDWYVWDSARGIVAGNDPYQRLNLDGAQVTNTDWVDTYSAGFELTSEAGNNVNINTATYIFLAIA